MKVTEFECFVITHHLAPRTGPSIAYSSEHAYVLVRLIDENGIVGWGETYRTPGTLNTIEAVCRAVAGRKASLRDLIRDARWVGGGLAGGGFAPSAVSIALEDLRARQLGISVSELYGGPMRSRIRPYAASGGYVEGQDPAITWPRELERALEAGYTALKLRVGRDPINHEEPLLRALREEAPPGFELMADGNAAYSLPDAIRMGLILQDLGFRWYEEPMQQRGGYVGYDRLTSSLSIAIAGGEGSLSPGDALRLLRRNAVDVIQPDPVICGGVGDSVAIADMATIHGITTVPHASNNAIGIAASLQIVATLPDATRSPSVPDPLLEYGIDENPNRVRLLIDPPQIEDGWLQVPTGPGLGIEIDEDYLRSAAIEHVRG
ncbi:MAG: mandelate racemase/muconate lactonizing enzyme family protein [Acidimicrobiia bacterium]|nr:mandelate racemase/muconate lactonizing enzyme family protein [Acidimicrobiia bacterium]MDH3462441.1 mandelate racemase/muconate lactonizing enzyme family protein [Acidimicrobiia bacterium]